MSDSVFVDVKRNDFLTGEATGQQATNIKTLEIGKGSKVFRSDSSGIWLGAAKFADAPFSVDMDGNLTANTAGLISSIDIGGADTSSFHVDADGNMWLGAATYAASPAKISKAGALIAKSVSIVDSADGSIVDSSGLVSTTQFLASRDGGSGTQTTDDGGWAEVTGISVTFTLDRQQNVLIFGQLLVYSDGSPGTQFGYGKVTVDGTQVGVVQYGAWQSCYSQDVVTLAAGSHTAKLYFKTSAAGANVICDREKALIGYVTLGK